ncbi:MAG: flagellar biosynthesis anti-sigma factor FlgM [Lachnospiraceae bacterium]|nr:flagellar biosynthesis anti-sigma factor FlgM [Lachnospiraceae bacterium]
MRIETYNQVAQLYKTGKNTKTGSVGNITAVRDEVQISQAARDYQIAKQAVAGASDVREDKVAQLKASIDSGNYNVDTNRFASKLLEKYNAVMM